MIKLKIKQKKLKNQKVNINKIIENMKQIDVYMTFSNFYNFFKLKQIDMYLYW